MLRGKSKDGAPTQAEPFPSRMDFKLKGLIMRTVSSRDPSSSPT
jgi:hypothetical protein